MSNTTLPKGAEMMIEEWQEKDAYPILREDFGEFEVSIFDEWMTRNAEGKWEVRHDLSWMWAVIRYEFKSLLFGRTYNGITFQSRGDFGCFYRSVREAVGQIAKYGSFRITPDQLKRLSRELDGWAYEAMY